MRTSLSWLAVASVVAFALAGCGRDKPTPPPPSGSAASTAVAPAVTPVSGGVAIFVNDQPAGTISAAQLAAWPRLDTLVPPEARKLGTWELVRLDSDKPAPTELARPSGAYPDMVPAVFPGPDGGASFGMFDPVELARKGNAALREDRVKAIRIQVAQGGNRGQNDDSGGAGGDPTKLVLTVTSAAGTTKLSGDKLLGVPRESMPGNADQKGWRLVTLLDAAGVKTYQRLVLTDASGTSLSLDKAEVSDTSVPFVKLNKQGALRLRVLKKTGDGWNPSGDLRALVSIDAK